MEQLLRVAKSRNSSHASRETAAQFYPTHRTTEIQKIKQQFTDWQTLARLGMPPYAPLLASPIFRVV